jgi:hypothetical protein
LWLSQRFIFDTMLLLHSLLNHLHGGAASSAQVQFEDYLDLLDNMPPLPSFPPRTHLSATYLKERCPTIYGLLNRRPTRVLLSKLLVEILYLETADFLHDLENTDEAITAGLPVAEGATPHQLDNGAASPVLGKGTGSVQKTPSSADKRTVDPKQVSATKGSGAKGTLPRTESSSLPIPVAELVVAAHAALLLHTLEGNTSLTSNSGQKLLGSSPQTEQPARAIDALPRGDWWLCVRVLKAFLTLQGQVRSSADAYLSDYSW